MTSSIFAITPTSYMRMLAGQWLYRNWHLLALPLAAIALWATFDIRALYIGLIFVFLLYPMSLTVVWFSYVLSPHTLRVVAAKQVTVTAEGLLINYTPNDNYQKFDDDTILWSQIKKAELSSIFLTLITGRKIDQRILLRIDAFSVSAWEIIMSNLSGKLPDSDF